MSGLKDDDLDNTTTYDWDAIRKLLLMAFPTWRQLDLFCIDNPNLKPALQKFPRGSLIARVEALLVYCAEHNTLGTLLDAVQAVKPDQYELHGPYLRTAMPDTTTYDVDSPTIYSLDAIYGLLQASFKEAFELKLFCSDRDALSPAIRKFPIRGGLNDWIKALLVYCEEHHVLGELLRLVRVDKPGEYEQYGPYLYAVTPGSTVYDVGAIRILLQAGFNALHLEMLCRNSPDLEPALRKLPAKGGLDDWIEVLLIYCQEHHALGTLLARARAANPNMYEALGPYMRAAPLGTLTYNVDAIRVLLQERFTAPDLERLCHNSPDLEPAISEFPVEGSLDDWIEALLTYCEDHRVLGTLLAAGGVDNPRQYVRLGLSMPVVEPKVDKEPVYILRNIRNLVINAFTDRELRQYCSYQPTFEQVSKLFGSSTNIVEMADVLVEYCEKRGLFEELLNGVHEANEYQWKRCGPYKE